MSDINEKAHFATSGNGLGLDYIQWLNFGPNLSIKSDTILTIENTLANGYTFYATIKGTSYLEKNNLEITAQTLPLEDGCLGYYSSTDDEDYKVTGFIYYSEIDGYVALTPPGPTGLTDNTWYFIVDDIVIKDSSGNSVSNYFLVVADAQQTNMFSSTEVESNTFIATNGIWSLYENILTPSISREDYTGEGQLSISGLSTNYLKEYASEIGYNYAPIFVSQCATSCYLMLYSPLTTTIQAAALGIIITPQSPAITKSPTTQSIITQNNEIVKFTLTFKTEATTEYITNYKIVDVFPEGFEIDTNDTVVYVNGNEISTSDYSLYPYSYTDNNTTYNSLIFNISTSYIPTLV